MLTARTMVRLAQQGQFDRLLDQVLDNGRSLPKTARLRLHDPERVAVTALGLALQRSIELTRRPGTEPRALAAMLMEELEALDAGDPLAFAAALRGLRALHRAGGGDRPSRAAERRLCDELARCRPSASTDAIGAALAEWLAPQDDDATNNGARTATHASEASRLRDLSVVSRERRLAPAARGEVRARPSSEAWRRSPAARASR